MNVPIVQHCLSSLKILVVLLIFGYSPAKGADGKKWDGKAYPFKALDPTQPNSESNPFIIDTAGKLAYLYKLSMMQDLEEFGRQNGLKGLNWSFKDNFVKITADLDLNGAMFEFVPISGTWINVDGGGHVITNLRISDKKTPPVFDDMEGTAEISLALFQGAESIKNLGIGKGSTITYNSSGFIIKGQSYMLSVSAASIATVANVMDGCFSDATIIVKGRCEAVVGGVATNCRYRLSNCHFGGSIIIEGDMINAVAMNKQGIERPGDLLVGGICARPGGDYPAAQKHGGIFNSENTGSIAVKASGNEMQIGGVAAIASYTCECIDIGNKGKVTVSTIGDIKSCYVGGVLGMGYTSQAPMFRPWPVNDSGLIYNRGDIHVTIQKGTKICVGGISGGDSKGFQTSSFPFGGVYGFLNTCNNGSISVSSTNIVDALNIGGITGFGSMVFNSYNTGNITGESGPETNLYAGGIGGKSVYAQNCYSIGAMSGKGSGKNMIGGIIGLANNAWGEDEDHRYVVMDVFWLHQTQPEGINHDIPFGKGSYFYKTSGKMTENPSYGPVFYFESPTATVLARSDDGSGKRKPFEATLLQALNKRAQKYPDRKMRLWKIDGSNGGYPVFNF